MSNHNKIENDDIINQKDTLIQKPNLDILIELDDSIYKSIDSVKMMVRLTNTQKTTQRFLFDKPFGMIPIRINILDTNETPMIYKYWSSLSETLWLEGELDPYYYELKPNETIKREFYLIKIAIIRNPDIEDKGYISVLKNGEYSIKASFWGNYSSTKKFFINSKKRN